jgi:hypothetical protein
VRRSRLSRAEVIVFGPNCLIDFELLSGCQADGMADVRDLKSI